jgi:hypothetical protein
MVINLESQSEAPKYRLKRAIITFVKHGFTLLLVVFLVLPVYSADTHRKVSLPPAIEKIRAQTAKHLKQRIDPQKYPHTDPYYLEHSMALEAGKRRVKNRTLILKDLPKPGADYLQIPGQGMLYQVRPDQSNTHYLYVRDGSLFLVYIVQGKTYPTVTYVYNVSDANGQLQAFSINPSSSGSYIFDRDGRYVSQCQGEACDDLPTRY